MPRRTFLSVLASIAVLGCLEDDAPEHQSNISVQISAAALGDGCGTASSDAGRAGPGGAASCAEGSVCGPICQPTNMQMMFAFDDVRDQGAIPVEVIEVRLRNSDGERVGVLSTRAAQVWASEGYVAWDGMIAPGETRASYTLSDPDWSTIGAGETWGTYSMTFTLEVIVEIDGVRRTLTSGELTRTPQAVT